MFFLDRYKGLTILDSLYYEQHTYISFSWYRYMFRRSLGQILLLAVIGVGLSSVFSSVLVKGALESNWSWTRAMLLGSILSATDPVAVVALMEASGAPVQIITLMEGESLLNDGFAMVAFNMFELMALGEEMTAKNVIGDLL